MKKTLYTLILLTAFLTASAQKIKTTSRSLLMPEQAKIYVPDEEGIEVPPEFPGGQIAFNNYVKHTLKWPAGPKLTGRVLIGFVIKKNGEVSDIKVIKKLSPRYDAEAIRVVRNSPRWRSGKRNKGNGWKPTNTAMKLPINFSLN